MGKKGSGKLAKMSEEERLIYLETQRVAEEEMRKKKEDMLIAYLKVLTVTLILVIVTRSHIGRKNLNYAHK